MKTVCVDFDGVLNTYSGWKGEDELFEPRSGAEDFLKKLSSFYKVVVFTTRPSEKVNQWLMKNCLKDFVSEVTSIKPPAIAYIDDRAVLFQGNFDEVFEKALNFKTHWEV